MTPTKPRVLFVDDEPAILKGFKLNLGRKYQVFVAESGRDGLRVLEEDGPFQVIVSDFSMPGMNGADFLEKVREQNREVVTMLLTGQACPVSNIVTTSLSVSYTHLTLPTIA